MNDKIQCKRYSESKVNENTNKEEKLMITEVDQ